MHDLSLIVWHGHEIGYALTNLHCILTVVIAYSFVAKTH